MKILIITEDVGRTAPGIVFEKLINGLSCVHKIDLLVANYAPTVDLSKVVNVFILKTIPIHPRIRETFISIFNVNPLDVYWAKKSIKILKEQSSNQYDILLSFLSYSHYCAIIAGYYFSRMNNIKFAVHTTDAIPPPIGWLKYGSYYRGLKKMICKYLSSIDFLFSTNLQMLNYQLTNFDHKDSLLTKIIYNPGLNNQIVFSNVDTPTYNFVYTGGIYGLRKAEYILMGFQKLLKEYPNSKLQFIGSRLTSEFISSFEDCVWNKIEIIPYTLNLDKYYKDATALIDIDADIENDIFMSSKMPNYLMINRIIICETGINSPSRHLFQGINSIIQCDHNADQLYIAMGNAIEMKNSVSFDDRNSIIQLFKIENIVNQLTSSFENSKVL